MLLVQTAAETVIADKGYDAQARVLELLPAQGKGVVIASCSSKKAARDYDPHLFCKSRCGKKRTMPERSTACLSVAPSFMVRVMIFCRSGSA